jgi:hypothetical protein
MGRQQGSVPFDRCESPKALSSVPDAKRLTLSGGISHCGVAVPIPLPPIPCPHQFGGRLSPPLGPAAASKPQPVVASCANYVDSGPAGFPLYVHEAVPDSRVVSSLRDSGGPNRAEIPAVGLFSSSRKTFKQNCSSIRQYTQLRKVTCQNLQPARRQNPRARRVKNRIFRSSWTVPTGPSTGEMYLIESRKTCMDMPSLAPNHWKPQLAASFSRDRRCIF